MVWQVRVKLLLELYNWGPAVPKGLGSLELQAFQDIDSDGPNASDPFAQTTIDVAGEDIEDVELILVVGLEVRRLYIKK